MSNSPPQKFISQIKHPSLNKLQVFLEDASIQHFIAKELTWIRSLKVRIIPPEELWGNILETLRFLEDIRPLFGPIAIISGYRDNRSNQAVGGARKSQHLMFRALDSRPVNRNLLSNYKKYIMDYWYTHGKQKKMGIGGYPWGVHVDFDFKYRRWGRW